jgi:hypothetical protein
MDALLSATKSAAAESIMLSEVPLTLVSLVQSVKSKLDRKDLIQCVVLGETLRGSAPVAGVVEDGASPSLLSTGPVAMTDGVDISLTRLMTAVMLRDPQFCLSQAGFCLYPCRPSVMARCSEVNDLFSATLYPPTGAGELPFFQYRRCFGALAKASMDNLAVAMQPLVGRQGVLTPGIHTSPSLSSWLERWENFLSRAPLRGATFNSLFHQFSHSRRMDWNRDIMKPVASGLITTPISIRSLELLLNYQAITAQRKRMPFREWLQMGLMPDASWLDRPSRELFLAVSQSRTALAELNEQRLSSDGLLHRSKFPSSTRSLRQFAPQLYRRGARAVSGSKSSMQWKWNDTMTDEKNNLSNVTELFAFSRANVSQPEKVKREVDVDESISVIRSALCDEDVMVFHGSRAAFSTTIFPIVRALDKHHIRSASPTSVGVSSTLGHHKKKGGAAGELANLIPIADVARAALWTHEYGEQRAVLWMAQYLRRFPKSVRISSGGQWVSIVK